MIAVLAILAGASLTFLPLSLFVRRLVVAPITEASLPPLPSGSLETRR
jgi:hypothetical protein